MSLQRFKFVDARWFHIALGAALSLSFTLLFFEPSLSWGYFPATQEELRYASLLRHFQAAQADGVFYPRWLPDLYGGYGYPTFIFYQPFFFFMASLVSSVFGVGTPLACQLTCGLLFFVGALGAYFLGYTLSHKKIVGGFWCCMTFTMAPYLVTDYSLRGAFSEFAAMVLTPWPLYASIVILERLKAKLSFVGPALIYMLSLAAIICAHPATALLFFPVLLMLMCVFVLSNCDRHQRKFVFQHFSLQTALALSLSSFYWWPVFQMKKWVNLKAVTLGYYDATNHLINFGQLFGREWSWSDGLFEMSFQLSLTHFVLAMIALCFVWRVIWFRWVGILYLVTLLCIYRNPISEIVWAQDTLLKNIQFPWRALSLVVVLQAVLSVGFARLKLKRGVQWGIALGVCVWFIFSQQDMRQVSPKSQQRQSDSYAAVTQRVESEYKAARSLDLRFANMDEFLPISARSGMPPRDSRPLVETRDGSIVEDKDHTRHHIKVSVNHTQRGIVRIHQLYLDGWKILLDGSVLSLKDMREGVSKEGFIQVVVPQGQHRLEAFYGGPPGHLWRILLSLFLFGCYFWYLFRAQRTKKEAL